MDQYEKLEKIREGTYGKLFVNTWTGIFKLLSVEQVVKKDKRLLFLVFEYFDTDLKKFIDPSRLPPKTIQRFMYQLCKALDQFHSRGVIPRDLKPQNLLVDKKRGLLKVGVLGLGRANVVPVTSYRHSHEIATLWYRAPEVLLGTRRYATPMDIWLLGTPTEEMWPGVTSLQDWHEYPQWKPMNLDSVVPNLSLRGRDLLSLDPAKRISAKEALDHPYFDNLDKSQF